MRVRGLRTKLLFSFVAVILLPLLTLGVLGPLISARTIERETRNHIEQMIEQVSRNIDVYIQALEGVISIVTDDPTVREFFGFSGTDQPYTEADESRATRLLKSVTDARVEIAGVLLVNEDERWLSGEIQPITRDPLVDEGWYRMAKQSLGNVLLLPRPIGRNLRSPYNADDIVSVVKAVVDARTGRIRGVVLIDMRLGVVEEVFRNTTLGKDGFLYIGESGGGIVYAPVNNIVYRIRPEWLDSPTTSIVRNIRGAEYQIVSRSSDYTGWKTIGVFPLNEIMRQVSAMRYYTVIIGGVTVIFAFLASIFFTGSIAKPVIALESLMKEAEEGNLAVRFRGGQDDEIGHLGKSFNAMIEEIQKLIDLVYREQHSKREAELKMLQEQIKPHFLYNTLDTIQWMAQDHGAHDIVQVVGALTSLFRIGLSRGKETITVRDELEHVRSYLIIQKARYEEKFDFTLEAPDTLLPFMVLKLTLQPLVENAIYHGIKERRGHGTVRVEALRRDGMLVLRVQDDGVGMGPEKLGEIRRILETATADIEDQPGYGIRNVQQRIQLSFGPDYGLRVESSPDHGTTVEVLHPLVSVEA